MAMFLFHFCQWLQGTWLSTSIRESEVVYPLIETVHVLAIALLAGTVAAVDLRLLGWTLKKERVSDVAEQVLPLTWVGFALLMVSGLLLFCAEAEKSYTNTSFRIKMLLLLLAGINPLIFHSTIYKSVGAWDEAPVIPRRARAAAIASLMLWSGIIITGRAIAYF